MNLAGTRAALFAAALFIGILTMTGKANALDPDNTLYMDLKDGRVVIEMRPNLAPRHVARIKELVRQGFYDGLTFHRVIAGFMAQGGDPKGDGTGGSGQNIPAEFSAEPHVRGTTSMARSGHPDSADSQFFITFSKTPHLDGKYTVFGRLVSGHDTLDRIVTAPTKPGGEGSSPVAPVKVTKTTVLLAN